MKRLLKTLGIIFMTAIIGFSMIGCDSNTGSNDKFIVTFEQGEGGGTAPADQTVESGKKITLPGQGAMTAPIGKEFDGWMSGAQKYAADDQYTVDADITFTAQWETVFTITIEGLYDLGGGLNMWGVSLMTTTDRESAVATGTNMSGDGSKNIFTLTVPGLLQMPTSTLFNTSGDYYVGLSAVSGMTPKNAWLVCDGNGDPVKVTFDSSAARRHQTFELDNADDVGGEGHDIDGDFVQTIIE